MSEKDITVAEEVDESRGLGSGARKGEYIAAGEEADALLSDEHTTEKAAQHLRGNPDGVDVAKIDPDWVLRRLVKEATDFGTRTRQSGRLKALELIGRSLGMFDAPEQDGLNDNQRAAREMTQEQRAARIRKLAQEVLRTNRTH